MEQIKASAGADDLVRRAQHRAGLRRRRAAMCGRFEKIDRRSRIGGLKPMGALRHDLHRAFSADARHGGAEPRGTDYEPSRSGAPRSGPGGRRSG